MAKYNFLRPYLFSEIQNHFLKHMISFSAKSMRLISVKFNFASLQFADAVTSEILIEGDVLPIT